MVKLFKLIVSFFSKKFSNKKLDKYDHAIAYLRKNPDEISEALFNNSTHIAGCLFKRLGNPKSGGDLRFIKGSLEFAIIKGKPDYAITKEIVEDERVPYYINCITLDKLEIFAYYQRRFDSLENS